MTFYIGYISTKKGHFYLTLKNIGVMNLLVSLDDAREFLRMDGQEDDGVIASLLAAAETLCLDVLRLKGEEAPDAAMPVLRTAILYAMAYLYEHREEADHARLLLTLRALLAGERKEEF